MFVDDEGDEVDEAGRVLIHLDPDLALNGRQEKLRCLELLLKGINIIGGFDGNESNPEE